MIRLPHPVAGNGGAPVGEPPHPDGPVERLIERLFARHTASLLRWPVRWAAVVAAATVLLFAGLPRLAIDVRLNAFVVENDPDFLAFHHLRERFDNDELLLVVIRPPAGVSPLDPAMIAGLGAAHDAATTLDSVVWVSSLARARRLTLGNDTLSFQRWVPADGVGEGEAAAILADGQVRGRLAGRHGESLILRLGLSDSDSPTLVTAVDRLLARHLPAGSRWATVGTPVIKQELRRALFHDARLLVPVASVGSLVILAIGLGSVRRAVPPLATALLTSGWTLGVMGWVGAPLTVVSAIAPALILVLALTDGVHLTAAVHRDGVRAALLRVGPACLWTSATTAAGFLGLSLMGVPALIATGVWMAIGVAVGLFHAVVTLPLFLHLQVGNPLEKEAWEGRLPRCRRPRVRAATAIVLLALLIPGIGRLHAETDMVRYFPADGSLRVGYREAEAALGGSTPLSVMIERRDGKPLLDTATLGEVVRLRDALAEQPLIASVRALPDLLATLRGEGSGVVGEAEGAQLLLLADLAGASGPARALIDHDHRATRLLLLLPELSSARMVEIARWVDATAEGLLGDDYRVTVAGTALHEARMMNLVSQGLRRGMVAALAVIGLLFWALMGSWRWGLAAMLPNLLPVGGVLGIMGWTGMCLDFSTAMIGSVALGLAVDDTIHMALSYRHARGRGMGMDAALEETVRTSGAALKLTTWVLVAGFALLALSTFGPTRHFGLLTCLCLTVALAADLWLFPALVRLLEGGEAAPA